VYLPAFVGSHVFAITRERVVHLELPRQDVVRRQVLNFRRRLQDEHGGEASIADLRELGPTHDITIGNTECKIHKKFIYVWFF
jgi:hypothetical protein